MIKRIIRFARGESAAAAIEYGLIASQISVAVIAAITTTVTNLTMTFTPVGGSLK